MSHNYRRQAWQACQQEIGEKIKNMRLELDLPPQIAAELLHIGLNQLYDSSRQGIYRLILTNSKTP